MGRIVLVTGVSKDLGGRFARRIAADAEVDRVIGVDVVPPRRDLGAVRFVRADIRNPVIAKVIAGEDVDTVVHASVVASARNVGGRLSMKEHNVIGTMQLLAACQRAPGLQRLVVKSSAEVYGASPRDPAMFTEDMSARRQPRGGYGKDVLEVEGYVRGFARRRPDVAVTLLRNANTISSYTSSVLAAYLRLSPVPTVLGYDARVQLLHYDDLVAVLHHTTLAGVHGTFNVAGDGVMPMSQVIRKLGRVTVPAPGPAIGLVGSLLKQSRLGLSDFSPEQLPFLTYGRGLDTRRMRELLGFEPRYTTDRAIAEFATSLPSRPVTSLDQLVTGALGGSRG
jgi:UDP-glucose 4-epimerase